MRPVRLDLHGFASFREPATVDFNDVDYFALIGPTGAGKSTIIDAITFALYGTAHRWERANSIAYALAPTTSRCTVSLIFDVAGRRYQVAREVRRVGQQIQQKAARLERFLDPTACPAPGDDPVETEVLVSEVRDLTPAMCDLLGMEFDDFCQCVVLPQGEFARFLKATPRERQTILLKLLGSGHYEQIGKVAGARAKEAEKEVEMYADQLRGLAEVTPEARQAATTRRDVLAELNAQISDLVAPVLAARTAEETHANAAAEANAAVAALREVKAPGGLVDRHANLTSAKSAHSDAASKAADAAAAFNAATTAAESGPQKMALDAAETLYSEADQVRSSLEKATRAAEETRAAASRATEAWDVAQRVLRDARTADQHARAEHEAAAAKVKALTDQVQRLSTITAPTDLADLAAGARNTAEELARADSALADAKDAAAKTAAACQGLPDPRTLQSLDSERTALAASAAGWDAGAAKGAELAAAAKAAAAGLAESSAQLDTAWAALEDARTRDAAAALRPSLQVGHECPVCTQTVTALPEVATDGPTVETLTAAWRTAQAAQQQAEDQHRAAVRAAETFTVQREAKTREMRSAADRLTAAVSSLAADTGLEELPAPIGEDVTGSAVEALVAAVASTLTAAEARCREAFTSRDEAAAVLAAAEKQVAATRVAAEQAQRQIDGHRAALVRAHTGVESDGAPAVDTSTLEGTVAGWASLTAWAAGTAEQIQDEQLPAATTAAEQAQARACEAAENLSGAETAATEAASAASQAAAAAAGAAATLEQLTSRDTELTGRLASVPARAALPALLAEAETLSRARADAAAAAELAQQFAKIAEEALQAAQAAVTADRDALGAIRDTVTAWSPPTFNATRMGEDLAGCFDELVTWAESRAAEQEATAADAAESQAQAAADAAKRVNALTEQLTEHDLPVAGVQEDPRSAERLVAVAHTQAAAAAERLSDALARKDEVLSKSEEARKRAIVAGELRTLLRSDKFQQWLATAALDTLVAGASTSLFELSGGQFTLTHEKGEFFVIDHFDADSLRSVRTLSGGETFQASLALALALSEQLASLAVGGNARLDSIFLDEGFGTLDPDALETVAATLENLAQGERMVGVVTHVAALAERTPIRFLVSHDNRTSRVEREAG
ncbi:SMC family ATPase [uncultured Ornithinimicrobium sp.]|uniref:AAA family ATPase n=1 Tax=uncultured Ornithinimicrobium sp. TaxID=259307 RepID=UPI00259A2749|nr:SMC family ATPase [uncultured Ornithinimicrobium sp.]